MGTYALDYINWSMSTLTMVALCIVCLGALHHGYSDSMCQMEIVPVSRLCSRFRQDGLHAAWSAWSEAT